MLNTEVVNLKQTASSCEPAANLLGRPVLNRNAVSIPKVDMSGLKVVANSCNPSNCPMFQGDPRDKKRPVLVRE